MAATVQIQVSIDDKGVVTGLQNIGTAVNELPSKFNNLGNAGHQAYDRMSNDWEKAHVAQVLAARTIGVEIPRALETMMLQSQGAMKIFGALFSVTTTALFIQGLASVLPKLREMSDWAVGYTQEVKDIGKEAQEASQQALVDPKALGEAQKSLKEINEGQRNLQASSEAAYDEFVAQGKALREATPWFGAEAEASQSIEGYTAQIADNQENINKLAKDLNPTLEQTARLNQQIAGFVLQQQNAAEMAGKRGIAAQLQEFENQKREIMQSFPVGTPVSDPGVQKEFVAAFKARSNTITAMARDEAEAQIQAQAKATSSALLGMDQIRAKRAEEVREAKVLLGEGEINELEYIARVRSANVEEAAAEVVLRRSAEDQIRQLRDQTNAIGLQGAAKVLEEQRKADQDSEIAHSRSIITQEELDDERWEHQRASIKNMLVLERQYHESAIAAQQQANLAGLQGFARIDEQERQAVENAQRKFRDEFSALPNDDPIYIKAARDLETQITSIHREGLAQRQQDTRQNTETTIQEEERAAVTSLPPWQRADAQIVVSYQDTMRKIQQELDLHIIDEQDAQRRREAAWVTANSQIADNWRETRDKLANDLESLFTGDIGQNILKQVQHFFFQILASFLMMLGDMRQAGAGSGGIGGIGGLLGAIFGGMLGGKSGGFQLPGGVQPTFPGSPSISPVQAGTAGLLGVKAPQAAVISATFASPLPVIVTNTPLLVSSGGLGLGGGGGTPDLLGMGGGLQEPGLYGNVYPGATMGGILQEPGLYGNIYTGPTGEAVALPSSTAAAGGAQVTPAGYTPADLLGLPIAANWPGSASAGGAGSGPLGPLGIPLGTGLPSAGVGIPSLTARQGALGLAGAGIGMVGAKFGGTAGSIGGMIAMLSMAAAAGSDSAIALLNFFGLSPALAAGAAGGLIGFGVGQKYGKLPGMLAGAGAGAGMGLILSMLGVVGGPIGMAIGAIVGLLGGLFGGLLGGSQRRAQANAYVTKTVEPALSKLLDDYNSFGTDFASAMAALIDIQTQALSTLSQLKGEGSDVYAHKVLPDIQKELDQIMSTETERQRRSSLTFGPPQFQEGGFISPELPRTATGGILAELHPYEFVSTAAATALHRQQLEAWNVAGATQQASQIEEAELSQRNLSSSTVLRAALPQFEQGGFVGTQYPVLGTQYSVPRDTREAQQQIREATLASAAHSVIGDRHPALSSWPTTNDQRPPAALIPSFDAGGLVGAQPAGVRLSNGQVLAALRTDEFVSNPQATARNRPALEAMNAGQPARQPTTVIIQAWDGESLERWLRNGGDRKLQAALRGSRREYSGGGLDIG